METNQISYTARVWNVLESILQRRLKEGASDLQVYTIQNFQKFPDFAALPDPKVGHVSMYLTSMVRSGRLVREKVSKDGGKSVYGYRLPRAGEALPEKGWTTKQRAAAKAKRRAERATKVKPNIFTGTARTPAATPPPPPPPLAGMANGWHAATLQELIALDVQMRGDGKGLTFRLGGQRYNFGVAS